MQSSGASLLALLVGQIPRSVVIVDLWTSYLAPRLVSPETTVIKAVISDIPLSAHLESYRPTMKILNLRHPIDVVASLEDKVYRDEGGTLKEKLLILEQTFIAREQFDLTIFYEDLISHPGTVLRQLRDAGISLPRRAEKFHRNPASIVSTACEASHWCRLHYNNGWGLGNAHLHTGDNLVSIHDLQTPPRRDDPGIRALALEACPSLLGHYVERAAELK